MDPVQPTTVVRVSRGEFHPGGREPEYSVLELSSNGVVADGLTSFDAAVAKGQRLSIEQGERPIFGVQQAGDGYQLLSLVQPGGYAYNDRPVPGNGWSYERAEQLDPSIHALVGASAYRALPSNDLHMLPSPAAPRA